MSKLKMWIEKEIHDEGVFYIQGHEDLNFPGTLTIKQNCQIEIDIYFDKFDEFDPYTFSKKIKIGGKIKIFGKIILEDCSFLRWYNDTSHNVKYILRSKKMICIRNTQDFNLLIKEINVSFLYLKEWINIEEIQKNNFINYPDSIELNNGLIVSLYKIKNEFFIKIKSIDAKNIDWFINKIEALECLISFNMKRICPVIKFYYKDESNKSYQILYHDFSYFIIKQDNKSIISNNIVTLYSILFYTKNYNEILNNWYRIYEQIKPVYLLYKKIKTCFYISEENRFLSLVRMIEALHKRIDPNLSSDLKLKDRLKHILNSNKKCINNVKEESLSLIIKNVLNFVIIEYLATDNTIQIHDNRDDNRDYYKNLLLIIKSNINNAIDSILKDDANITYNAVIKESEEFLKIQGELIKEKEKNKFLKIQEEYNSIKLLYLNIEDDLENDLNKLIKILITKKEVLQCLKQRKATINRKNINIEKIRKDVKDNIILNKNIVYNIKLVLAEKIRQIFLLEKIVVTRDILMHYLFDEEAESMLLYKTKNNSSYAIKTTCFSYYSRIIENMINDFILKILISNDFNLLKIKTFILYNDGVYRADLPYEF